MFNEHDLIKNLRNGTKSFFQLVKILNVDRHKNQEFSKWLFSLVKQGKVFKTPKSEYYIPKFEKHIKGTIRLNERGFGFVEYAEDGAKDSVFIPPFATINTMDGDAVAVKIFKDPFKEGSYQGIISEIITRNRSTFVGRVVPGKQELTIVPNDVRIKGQFKWVNTEGLKEDYEVKVEIISYDSPMIIKLIKVLGHMNDVSIDILAEIEDSNIPCDFTPETLAEVNTISDTVQPSELKDRVDLRNNLIVTIDGDDTKDFDDAIEVKKLANGNYFLGVHIADVTNYVIENTVLDDEAQRRGTSVYLADRVIPMLPKKLSNGICSLNPHVDRLTMTCECEIDPQGNTVSHKIYPSVINSKYRLTYQEVNKYFHKEHTWDNAPQLHRMLDEALALSKIIRNYKTKQGYIDFEIEEAKIIVGDDGTTKDIVARERLESEILIEDFMVRANETVAHHTEDKNLPFIYRTHDKPDSERVINLQAIVKTLGMDIKIPQVPIPAEFAKAVEQIKKTRFDDFMKIMMLRTMAKAEYSPNNIGHFGLASTSYSHFTSPIRRYPDLIAHRMLREYFFKNNKKQADHFASILPNIAKHSSFTEQRAMELERKVADIKKAEFYEQFVGQTFEGTIVSMLKFGFFVEFPNKVDGLIHTSTLIDGEYKLSSSGYSLETPNRKFTVGDKVRATVVNVVKKEGKIDLVIEDLYVDWKKREANLMKNRKN